VKGYTLKEENGTWTARWAYVGPDGKRLQPKKRGFRTRKAAETFLSEELARYGRVERVEPSKMTLRQYVERDVLPIAAQRVKPSTLRRYTDLLAKVTAHRVGALQLQQLTPGDLARLSTTTWCSPGRTGPQPTLKPSARASTGRSPASAYR
jgi:hypothetical protein